MARRHLARLALLFGSVAVTLLAVEAALRAVVPTCGVTPFRVSDDPDLIHELRPSFETLYKGERIRINSLGFRGPMWPAKRPGVRRVALVGDSVTFGSAIPWEQTLGVALQGRFDDVSKPVEVLNAGVPGLDAGSVAALLERRVLPHEPDVVVYVFVFNDGEPPRKAREIDPEATIDAFADFPLRSALLQYSGMRLKALLRVLGRGRAGAWVQETLRDFENGGRERVRSALERMRRACDARGIPLLCAIYPHMTDPEANPFRTIDEAAEQLCRELRIPCVHLGRAFRDQDDMTDLWANPFDAHPNGVANARAASLIAEALERHGML